MPARRSLLQGPTRRRWMLVCTAAAASLCGAAAVAQTNIPGLIDASRPSVVPVGTFSAVASPRFSFRGSGFVVADGNLVITNVHVLPEAGQLPTPQMAVMVAHADGSREARIATVVAQDRLHDLALLRLEGPALPALALADAALAREGSDIVLMGFPIGGVLGYSMVTHRGIIASVTAIALPSPTSRQLDARTVSRLREGPFPVYQLDATAYPGNSGGPLLDARTGQVVGIVNMVLVRGTRESALANPTGITYAIPVQFALDLIKSRP